VTDDEQAAAPNQNGDLAAVEGSLELGFVGRETSAVVPQAPMLGREAEMADLVNATARITVLVGDSGVGKSRLLREAADRLSTAEESNALAPPPIQLAHRPGALQMALLDSLAAVVAQHEESSGRLARWAQVLAGAAGKAASARVRDMVGAASSVLVGALRARFGDEAVDLVRSIGGQLTAAQDEQLIARISSQSDPDALAAFCLLAAEVHDLTRRPMMLSIDRLERLEETDFRIFLDLVEQLPNGVQLLVTHSTRTAEDLRRVRRVVQNANDHFCDRDVKPSPGIAMIALEGLPHAAVKEWMQLEQLEPMRPAGGLEEVMTMTAGYPLYVDLALRALRRGEVIANLTGQQGFIAHTQQNYVDLPEDDQRCVMLLSAFSDPPDREFTVDLLGISREEWATRERRLIEARLLVTVVDQIPWFHELGRRAVWEHVLTDHQRVLSAEMALNAMMRANAVEGQLSIAMCLDMSRLCRYSTAFVAKHEKVSDFLALNEDELAIFAALLEMTESGDEGASPTSPTISHARSRFGASGDLVATIRSLAHRSLVVVAEEGGRSVIVAVWGSHAAHFVAIGRIAESLQRIPLPSIASSIFYSFVSPRLGQSQVIAFGLGKMSAPRLMKQLHDAEYVRDGMTVGRRSRPGIVMRPRLGDLHLYGVANFESIEARDCAFEALSIGEAGQEFFGDPLWFEYILKWPYLQPLATRRYLRAVELVTGLDLTFKPSQKALEMFPAVSSVEAEANLAAKAWKVIRDIATPVERVALDLQRPRGLFFGADSQMTMLGRVVGVDGAFHIDMPLSQLEGPYWQPEIERFLQLRSDQYVSSLSIRAGGELVRNPIPGLIKETYENLTKFNKVQSSGSSRLIRLPSGDADISSVFTAAHVQRYDDATALIRGGVLRPSQSQLRHNLYVLLVSATVNAQAGRLRHVSARTLRMPSDENVVVCGVANSSMDLDDRSLFDRVFGIDTTGFDDWSYGYTTPARLLGHDSVRMPSSFY
jgi:energy-coupling factor transporter ATP-binding protein EcfA2